MIRLTDQDERDALLDGASALKYRAERLEGLTRPENVPERAAAAKFRSNAAILTEMADAYSCDEVSA